MASAIYQLSLIAICLVILIPAHADEDYRTEAERARDEALQSLNSQIEKNALKHLEQLSRHPDSNVRQETFRQLMSRDVKTIPESMLDALSDDHEGIRLAAVKRMQNEYEPPSVLVRELIFRCRDPSPRVQNAAYNSLLSYPPTIINPYLQTLLNSPHAGQRASVIQWIGFRAPEELIEAHRRIIRDAILDPHLKVKKKGLEATHAFPDKAAFKLLSIALSDDDRRVRMRTLELIEQRFDLKNRHKLLEMVMDDPLPEIRTKVIQLVQLFQDVDLLEFVKNQWADEHDPKIRLILVETLKDTRSVETLKFLKSAIETEVSPKVKRYALQLLEELAPSPHR